MIMIKKSLILCLFLSLLSFSAGCNRQVELRLGIFVGSNWDVPASETYTFIDRVIQRYEASHPGVHVIYESGIRKVDYSNQLMNDFLSGTEPDVFLIPDDDFVTLSSLGGLSKLDGRMSRDGIDPTMFYTSAYNAGLYDGNCYALPVESDATMMFVNKTLLEAAGIRMPDNEWTLDDFLSICQQITSDSDGDGKLDVFGCYNYTWLDSAYGYGVDLFDVNGTKCTLNTNEVRSAIQFIQKLQSLNGGYQVTGNMFDQGQVAFAPMSFAQYRTYKPYPWRVKKYSSFEWDCVEMPGADEDTNASMVSTLLAGISSRSIHQKEAWEFLKELTCSLDTQRDIMQYSQGLSVLREVLSDADTMDSLSLDMGDTMIDPQVLNDVMENGVCRDVFIKQEDALSLITSEIDTLIRNDGDIDLQLIRIQKEVNRYLNQ